jgi:hypothetical protein
MKEDILKFRKLCNILIKDKGKNGALFVNTILIMKFIICGNQRIKDSQRKNIGNVYGVVIYLNNYGT